ncbi:MAG: LCP family protein [Cellulosilyticaceae bacterium]
MRQSTKTLLKIFGISVGITLSVFLLLGTVGVIAYNTLIYQPDTTVADEKTNEKTDEEDEIIDNDHINTVLDERINKTVAIFGVDASERLTDVIFVVNFNSDKNEMNVISVPRDTKVNWTDEQRAVAGRQTSWINVSKLNEMTSYGGMENIRSLTIDQLERILGLRIDNYAIINLDAFKKIVDAVGGVDIDVPQRMYKVDVSGGLYIDLYPGMQHLDGNKAEQFVRYRNYTTGDLARIEAQQQFLAAFAKQVLSPQIITKIPAIISTLFTSIKTDVKLTEIIEYYPYIEKLPTTKVNYYMAQGTDGRENGISYFFLDKEETLKMVDDIFYSTIEE